MGKTYPKVSNKCLDIEEISKINKIQINRTKPNEREFKDFLSSLKNSPSPYLSQPYIDFLTAKFQDIGLSVDVNYKNLESMATKIKEKKVEEFIKNGHDIPAYIPITYEDIKNYIRDGTRFSLLVPPEKDKNYLEFDHALFNIYKPVMEETHKLFIGKNTGINIIPWHCNDCLLPTVRGGVFFLYKVYDEDLDYYFEIMCTTSTQNNRLRRDGFHEGRTHILPLPV